MPATQHHRNKQLTLDRKNSEGVQFQYFAYGRDSWRAKKGRYYTEWDDIRWRVHEVKGWCYSHG